MCCRTHRLNVWLIEIETIRSIKCMMVKWIIWLLLKLNRRRKRVTREMSAIKRLLSINLPVFETFGSVLHLSSKWLVVVKRVVNRSYHSLRQPIVLISTGEDGKLKKTGKVPLTLWAIKIYVWRRINFITPCLFLFRAIGELRIVAHIHCMVRWL